MTDINRQVGYLIYQIRQERGLTQAEFARRLKTSQSAVNRIERGKQNLSLKTLQRISEVLEHDFIQLNDPSLPSAKVKEIKNTGQLVITITKQG